MPDPKKQRRYNQLRDEGRSPDEAKAMVLREFSGDQSPGALEALGRGALSGLTLDFADELAGVGAALMPGGKGYREARDDVRAANRAAADAHPILYHGASLASGLAVPGFGAAKGAKVVGTAAKELTGAQRALRAAKAGAGMGALGGLGYGEREGLGGMAADAAIGGATGAALGAAMSPLTRGAEYVNRDILGRNDLANRTRAGRALGSILEDSGLDDAAVRGQLDEAARLGKPAIIGDLSDDTRSVLDILQNKDLPGVRRTGRFLTDRREGAWGRIQGDVEGEVGKAPQWATQTKKGILAAKEADASPLYRAAMEGDEAITDEGVLRAFKDAFSERRAITAPLMRRAYERGRQLALEETGEDLARISSELRPVPPSHFSGDKGMVESWFRSLEKMVKGGTPEADAVKLLGGSLEEGAVEFAPTVRALDYWKRGVDDLIGDPKEGLSNEVRRQLVKAKNRVLASADMAGEAGNKKLGLYREARGKFAGLTQEEKAIDRAKSSVRSNDSREFVEGLQEARDLGSTSTFRGVALDELLRPGRLAQRDFGTGTPDALNAITRGERAEMLKALAGNNWQSLEPRLRWEQRFNKTYNEAMSNSKTAKRLQGLTGGDLGDGVDYGIAALLTGSPQLGARAAGASVLKKLTGRGRNKVDALLHAALSGGISPDEALALGNISPELLSRLNTRHDLLYGLLAGSLGGRFTDIGN